MGRARTTTWPRRWAELLRSTDVEESLEVGAFLLSEWAEGASPVSLNASLDALAQEARRRLPPGWTGSGTSCSSKWSPHLITEAMTGAKAVSDELFEGFGLAGNREN